MNITRVYLIGGGIIAAALVAVYVVGAKNAGMKLGGAAVDLADGVIAGTVTGVGQLVGIPQTNQTECQKARAEGRTWDASFACPAGDFLSYLWN